MGLDMTAYSRTKDGREEELAYWRKHNALHGWMEALFRVKGGTGMFNGEEVELDSEDLSMLETSVLANCLPVTQGFFFGGDTSDDPVYKERDLEFIQKAREVISDGQSVIYNSSW